MFTNGQLIFGVVFAVVFIIAMVYAYRKDLKLHRKYYTGSIWILIAFIAFIAFIGVVKFLFM